MEDDLDPKAQLKKVLDTERKMRAMFEPSSAVKALMESERKMRAMFEPSSAVKAFMESERKMRAMFEPSSAVKALMESERKMRAMFEPSSAVKAFMESERKMRESIGEPFINRLATVAQSLTPIEFNINPDGSIVGQEASFKISDLQSAIASCINKSSASTSVSFEIRLNDVLDNVVKQHPILAKIIIFILLPIIINIYTSIYFTESTGTNHSLLIKQIKKEVQQQPIDPDLFKQFRFVSSPSLNVRSEETKKSRLVGQLYLGDVVKIVNKKKNWTLVEYSDTSGETIIRGWVFTRYLKKFN